MITIGGRELELRFDLAALRRIEQEVGTLANVGSLVETASGTSLLLWACLATSHPEITREQLETRLGIGDLGRVRTALSAAMETAFGEAVFDRPFEDTRLHG